MTLFLRRKRLGLFLALLVSFVCVSTFTGCRRPPAIRLHDGQWEAIHLINAIARFIIEKGYGYSVEIVTETSYAMQNAMPSGDIDATLDGRRQNWLNWYNDQVLAGKIVNLGVTFEGSSQFFVIPRWFAEEHGIETITDMREYWQAFRDPSDPSKGLFYNGIMSWGCNEINEVKLEAYGLTKFFNVVAPGSEDAWKAALLRAQKGRLPVFAYCWAPNAMIGSGYWHILKEPQYSDECWEEITKAVDAPSTRPLSRACAYKVIPAEKIAHRGLAHKCPPVAAMLQRMNIGLEPLNRTLAWAEQNEVKDWNKAAVHFLKNYEDRWQEWVTPRAYEKIAGSLKKARE